MNSTKSMTGHLLGASGAVEAVATVQLPCMFSLKLYKLGGRIVEKVSKHHGGSSSRGPPRSYRDDYYGNIDSRRRSRSRSLDRHGSNKYPERERARDRSRNHDGIPGFDSGHGRR